MADIRESGVHESKVQRLPYPKGLKAAPDLIAFLQRFQQSPKNGRIHHDPRISESFRFRLILLHEYIHLLHYPYVASTRQWLHDYDAVTFWIASTRTTYRTHKENGLQSNGLKI